MAKNKEKQRLSVAATQLEKFQFKVTCFADKLRRFCHWRNQQQSAQQPWSPADFSSSHSSPSPSLFPSATPVLPVAISHLCGCGNATHQPSHWGWTPPLLYTLRASPSRCALACHWPDACYQAPFQCTHPGGDYAAIGECTNGQGHCGTSCLWDQIRLCLLLLFAHCAHVQLASLARHMPSPAQCHHQPPLPCAHGKTQKPRWYTLTARVPTLTPPAPSCQWAHSWSQPHHYNCASATRLCRYSGPYGWSP